MLLVQANVLLKKANKSIVTDTDGNYIIKDLAAGDYEIAVSYTGFRTEKRYCYCAETTLTIFVY
jgi:outer membrane receptor for ferrienterochelin and colicins